MRKVHFYNITLNIFGSPEEASAYAANMVIRLINEKPAAVLGLATGETPIGMYNELIRQNNSGEVNFSDVITFNLDEYYPINKNNPQSFNYYMRVNLFDHINIDTRNTHIPDGEAKDAEALCAAYEKSIADAGGIDLQILGIGNNGHIGFNEPAAAFTARTHLVKLHKSTIDANARFFGSPADVPKGAVTMGIGTIMRAKKIILIAFGEKKAKILYETITGPITPNIPASVLQLHGDVTIITDNAAGRMFV